MGASTRTSRWLDRFRSVRTRIVAAAVVLTALALAGAGLAAYLVESAHLDQQIDDNVTQELEEFERLQSNGVDPKTGQAFERGDRLDGNAR